MIRLFCAHSLPADVAQALASRQAGLRDARWRPLESLHITLRFFGEVREDVADDLDEQLACLAAPAFELALAGIGCFGDSAGIEAVWAGVGANPALNRLARACEQAARRVGLKPDTRRYRPHVTLAYLRRPDPAVVAAWIQDQNLLRSPPFRVDRFDLYSSWQGRGGSHYRQERSYTLKQDQPGP